MIAKAQIVSTALLLCLLPDLHVIHAPRFLVAHLRLHIAKFFKSQSTKDTSHHNSDILSIPHPTSGTEPHSQLVSTMTTLTDTQQCDQFGG